LDSACLLPAFIVVLAAAIVKRTKKAIGLTLSVVSPPWSVRAVCPRLEAKRSS
jgi:hypothetical protein